MSLPFPVLSSPSERFEYDQFDDFIGEGKYGNVFVAVDIETGRRVALKVIEKNKLENARAVMDVVNEVELGRKVVKHPHCVSVLDAYQTEDKIIIVMELLEGSDLQVLVSQQRSLPEPLVRAMAAQLVFTLAALARMNIVHRDLKSENLMLAGGAIPVLGTDGIFNGSLTAEQYLTDAKVTLVDWGLAKQLPKSHHHHHHHSHGHHGQQSNVATAASGMRSSTAVNTSNARPSGSSTFTSTSTTQRRQIAPLQSMPASSQPQLPGINVVSSPVVTQPGNAVSNAFGLFPLVDSVDGAGSSTPQHQIKAASVMAAATSLKRDGDSNGSMNSNNQANSHYRSPSPVAADTVPSDAGSTARPVTNEDEQQQQQHQQQVVDTVAATAAPPGSSGGLAAASSSSSGAPLLPRQSSVQSLDRVSTNSPMVMTPCGTFGYSAPEIMKHLASMGVGHKQTTNRQDAHKRDLYSLGLCLYFAFTGRTPFNTRIASALVKQMETGPAFPPGPVWDNVSTDAKNFITLLLASTPDARPTAEMAMSHPWVADLCQTLKQQSKARQAQQGQDEPNAAASSDSSTVSATPDGSGIGGANNVSSGGSGGMLVHGHNNESDSSLMSGSGSGGGGTTSLALLSSLSKRKGKSYEDLAALHEMRQQCAQELDMIEDCLGDDCGGDSVPRGARGGGGGGDDMGALLQD